MHVDCTPAAAATQDAGIEMSTCELDETLPGIRRAVPGLFLQDAHPQSNFHDESGVFSRFRCHRDGCGYVCPAGSLRLVEALAREGIPVSGQIGDDPR